MTTLKAFNEQRHRVLDELRATHRLLETLIWLELARMGWERVPFQFNTRPNIWRSEHGYTHLSVHFYGLHPDHGGPVMATCNYVLDGKPDAGIVRLMAGQAHEHLLRDLPGISS